MTKTHTSAVVIIPPKNKWEPIQKIRRQYDKKVDRWMPHINLLYPFHSKNEYNDLKKDFTQACSNIKPFEIKLDKFKYFRHNYQTYTVWLLPGPQKPIEDLQAKILKLVPTCNNVNMFLGGFQPHLSVGQFITYKIQTQIQKLEKTWPGVRFLVDKIYFINRANQKNSKFSVIETIPLGNRK
ncbi:MAG: 2'-5' RNA ligase family protein [Candidatus Lokiarchaeota archaeon]